MRPSSLPLRFMLACCCLLAASGLAGTPVDVVILGDNPLPPPTSGQAPYTAVTQSIAVSMNSGESITWGTGGQADALGNPIDFYWVAYGGNLESLAAHHGKVRFTAPSVSVKTQIPISVRATSQSGHMTFGTITVTVSPPLSQTLTVPGQMSAAYSGTGSNFAVSYTLGATVSRAWILASLDGSTWTQVYAMDPVTSGNRTGSPVVTVAGSAVKSLTYFKLRVQDGASAPQDGAVIPVAYTPPVATPKSTELPRAPNLVINGLEVNLPQVLMFWGRVNDSLNQDNVVRYEVERATNPDFTNSIVADAGNTATGQNMYESILYTSTGLADDTTYYFRVRGVNYVGAGPWSSTDTIHVNVQDRPVFDVGNPVFPAHGAIGVTKLPALECLVHDPEGDPFYCAFEISESPTGPWRYFGHGGQQAYLNVTRLDPVEWNPTLKPNTHYYWHAIVNEEGRYLDYYGGTWPTSPNWEFTTESVGATFSISNVSLISGTLKAGEQMTYRATVTNGGNATSNPTLVQAFYVKNGVESGFAFGGWGAVPALAPGASTQTDITVMFQSGLVILADGSTRDNILITGASTLRFKTFPDTAALNVATYDVALNYVNAGAPVISALQAHGLGTNNPNSPLGGKFTIIAEVNDDIRTTRVLLEYRLNASAPWATLDDYTGNTGTRMSFNTTQHSGPTVPWATNALDWTFPATWGPTSTLQLRATAFDDAGAYSVMVSDPLTLYDGTLTAQAGAVQFPSYRLGDQVSVPLSVTKAPGMNITNLQVVYYATPSGPTTLLLNQGVVSNFDTLTLPPVLTVTLPTSDFYVSDTAFLRVTVRGFVPGLASPTVIDDTDGTFSAAPRDLPAPFHTAVNLFNQSYPGYPVGASNKSEQVESIALDWEGDTRVHALVQLKYSYQVTENSITTSTADSAFYHCVYDRTTGTVTTTPLPAGYSADDLKFFNGVPYVLLRSGTGLYWSWKSGGSFTTPDFLVNLVGVFTTTPEFVARNGELHAAYTTRNDVSGGGTPATWRNRMQRLLPSKTSYIEQAGYLGSHLDYGTSYLNAREAGIFGVNAGGIISSTVVSRYSNPLWFGSSSSSIVGAAADYISGHNILDLYAPSGVASRWNIDVFEPRVCAFPDVTLGVGQADTSSPAGENGFKVVVRRDNTTGTEERIKLGSSGQGFVNTGKRTAVSSGKWVAVNWNRLLAVGNMSADLVAPVVTQTTADSVFTRNVSKTFSWTMSDNLGQIASVKVIKIAAGVSTTLATYASPTLPTSADLTLTDTASSLIIRVEVYDSAGNRGVAEKVFTQNSAFTLTSFTAASPSVAIGSAAKLSWTSSPEDAFRLYNILFRPSGSTDWLTAGSVTGNAFALDTSLLSGSYDVRLESGGVVRDLATALTVTGVRFAFDYSGFSPVAGTSYHAASAPTVRLSWASNQPESTATSYTVLGRWNGSGNYVLLGSTTGKFLDVNVGANTQIEWKVSALWQGLESLSTVKTVALATLATSTAPTAVAGGRDTALPYVDLTWPAIPGAEAYAVFRRDTRSDSVEEIARPLTPAYHDDSIAFGQGYAYAVAPVLGTVVAAVGAETAITVTPWLPVGIAFVNAPYQVLTTNACTVQWHALLPAGTPSVFQSYDVILRQGDGTLLQEDAIVPAPGATPQVAYTALPYNQTFICEVHALDTHGDPLSVEPARLHFSTGFDTRTISVTAAVSPPVAGETGINLSWGAVANADYYDIFRKGTATGTLQWVGRSATTEFSDSSIPSGSGASYVIRAQNGLMHSDAAATTPVPFGQQTNFRISQVTRLLDLQDFEFKFNSQYGAGYRIQYSSDLIQWYDAGVNIQGSGEEMSVTAPGVSAGPRLFYRVAKP